jgi:hypothetical protein
MTKPKKHILAFDQAYDFEMIGICSHHNDYRLAWGLNEKIDIQLIKVEEDYVVSSKKGLKLSNHLIEYYLIKNKNQGKFLIPEKPSIDYFLFLFENHVWEVEDLVSELRDIPSVLGVFIFDPEELDSTENLVFN